MADWNDCEHEWRVVPDSQFTTEEHTEVVCTKCQCPGERDERTGEIFWPAT